MQCLDFAPQAYVYREEDLSSSLYFVLEGSMVVRTDQRSPAMTKRSGAFFGVGGCAEDLRCEDVQATEAASVIEIDRLAYENAKKHRQKPTLAEAKVEFLVRYVPRLRSVARRISEELEVFFIKEVYTRGYRIVRQGELDDYVYFVFAGECRVRYNLRAHADLGPRLDRIEEEFKTPFTLREAMLGTLRSGECFGEHSALLDLVTPFSVEAAGDVEVYKIHRAHLLKNFGGDGGEPVAYLRGDALVKTNWLQARLAQIRTFSDAQINACVEFANPLETFHLKPTKSNPKETPFLSALENPKLLEEQIAAKREENKKKEIAAIKEELQRPPQKRVQGGMSVLNGLLGGGGMNKIERAPPA